MVLLRVTLAFLVLILLPDWYIYKVYVSSCHKKWLRMSYWIPAVILLSSLLVFVSSHVHLSEYFGLYLILALGITIPKTIFTCSSLLFRGINRLFGLSLPHGNLSWIPALVAFTYIVYGAKWGKEHFQVKEVVFASPDLPQAFDGFRILQLSDIHSGSWNGDVEALTRAIDICNAQQADIIAFTGDLVNNHADEIKPLMSVFSRLKAKDGVYSVLGNHDYATYRSWESESARLANVDTLILNQKKMGWQVLMNEHRIIHRGNDSIALIGVENSGRPPFPDRADLPQALSGTDGMFKVLLSHDPTHWRRKVLPETDIQLMLAGHTHDMQISLFGFSVSRYIYPEHRGLYLEGARGLYVNIGLGFVLFPMRLGAWPEITIITLRRETKELK